MSACPQDGKQRNSSSRVYQQQHLNRPLLHNHGCIFRYLYSSVYLNNWLCVLSRNCRVVILSIHKFRNYRYASELGMVVNFIVMSCYCLCYDCRRIAARVKVKVSFPTKVSTRDICPCLFNTKTMKGCLWVPQLTAALRVARHCRALASMV